MIIDGLAAGEETYNEEETQYSLEEALDYLRGFLQELNDLNDQIIMNGNTAELLEEVHKKYTELWLFQLYFHVYSLPRVIGGLLRYVVTDPADRISVRRLLDEGTEPLSPGSE